MKKLPSILLISALAISLNAWADPPTGKAKGGKSAHDSESVAVEASEPVPKEKAKKPATHTEAADMETAGEDAKDRHDKDQKHHKDKKHAKKDHQQKATPAIPASEGKPATPAIPASKAAPATPAVPATPVVPANPTAPATPAVPASPAN